MLRLSISFVGYAALDNTPPREYQLGTMSLAKNTMLLVRLGIALLAFASFSHLVEHWETAVLQKCVSTCEHSHASSDDNNSSPSDQHHGCSAHEHSPAVLQTTLPLLHQPIVLTSPEVSLTVPPSIPRKIDQPPRIS